MNANGATEPSPPNSDSDDRSALAKALDKAYQLIAICAMVALPAVGGFLLDRWLGSGLLLTILGFVLGLATAIYQFLKLLKRFEQDSAQDNGKSNHHPRARS